MKFSRIKVALLTAGAIMSITPGITAISANSVFAQETVVSYDRVAAAEKKNGFVKEGGQWNYYVNGKTKTGHDIVYGTINGKSGWYYIAGGKADLKYTGVTNNKHGWWYVKNGKVDFGYNGFAKNSSGWWYIENGKVTFKKNEVLYGTVDGKSGWWNVKGSKVIFNTSVEGNRHGWWYVKNGKVDFGYNGFAKNSSGWWYIENGKVTFKKNDVLPGTVNGKNGWWNVKGSKVIFNTSVEGNSHGWWYIKNGKVDFSYTGLANNAHGWWYLRNGKVDFGYTGFAKNSNGWWYVEKGNITFKKTGVVKGTVNGKNSSWNVKGSKMTSEVKTTTTSSTSNSTAGWKTGVASAYGGYTDPGCGSITANGSRVTESSMGVAIPLAWGRRDLLGHKVEISYGGKTVTAVINDLGGMGGGSRALDLQPGVWRAFGFGSCNSWGVRTVKYRIL